MKIERFSKMRNLSSVSGKWVKIRKAFLIEDFPNVGEFLESGKFSKISKIPKCARKQFIEIKNTSKD